MFVYDFSLISQDLYGELFFSTLSDVGFLVITDMKIDERHEQK